VQSFTIAYVLLTLVIQCPYLEDVHREDLESVWDLLPVSIMARYIISDKRVRISSQDEDLPNKYRW